MSSPDFGKWESSSQIDPLILRLLEKKYEKPSFPSQEQPAKTRQLGLLYAAYIGISAMVIVILLGILRGTEVDEILVTACRSLLIFCGIGFITGKIAEMCVHESAKSMVQDMLRRTVEHQAAMSGDSSEEE